MMMVDQIVPKVEHAEGDATGNTTPQQSSIDIEKSRFLILMPLKKKLHDSKDRSVVGHGRWSV
jgi:hypothetical protein